MKTVEQETARALRAAGWSIKEIERELRVSRSSVSRWVRNVDLRPEQRAALEERVTRGRLLVAERKARAARSVRQSYQEEGRRRIHDADHLYVAGCMLYWAEGEKNRSRVAIANSDADLLQLFVRFLRTCFSVPDRDIRIYCHLHADHTGRRQAIERFWLETLGLPQRSLGKSSVNVYSKYSSKKRTNRLPNGTCRLTVNSTRIVQTIFGSLQAFGAFRRPAWID